LRDEDFTGPVPASIFDFSDRAWRHPVDHVVAEILPIIGKRENTKLRLRKGEPFTRLHERHFASGGDVIAVSVVDVDNAFFHFEVFRRR
jgi:hypothetical protein